MKIETVWVFCGEKSTFPSGVFLTRELAEAWISSHELSGALTAYTVNTGVYDEAVRTGAFVPSKASEKTPEFVQHFSDARQEHFYYKQGINESAVDLTSYPIGDYFVEVCHLGRSPKTGKWQVSVEISERTGTVVAKSGKIEADQITVELLSKLLPKKFSEDELSPIVESAWKDKFVL